MTDLKKLLIEFDTLTQKNRGLSRSKLIDLLESTLSKKFSVTLRGDDSSVDNNLEPLIMRKDIMSPIRGLKQGLRRPDELLLNDTDEFEIRDNTDVDKIMQYFTPLVVIPTSPKCFVDFKSVIKILQYSRRCDSHQQIEKDDLVADKELRSEISNVIQNVKDLTRTDGFGISSFDYADEIIKIFKTHQNTTIKPSTDKISIDDDLKSKFKDIVVDTICRQTEDDFRCLKDSDTFKLFESKLDKLISDNQLKFLNGGLMELFDSVDVIATRFATKVKFDGVRETYHYFEFKTELSKLFRGICSRSRR